MKKTIKKLAMVTLSYLLAMPLLTSCSSEEEEAITDGTTEVQQITEDFEQEPEIVELGDQNRRIGAVVDGNDVQISVQVLRVRNRSIDIRIRAFPKNRRNFNQVTNRRRVGGDYSNLLAVGDNSGKRVDLTLTVTNTARRSKSVNLSRTRGFTVLRSENRPGISLEDVRLIFSERLPNEGAYVFESNFDLELAGSATSDCGQCCEISRDSERELCQRLCIGTPVNCNVANPSFVPPRRVRGTYAVQFLAARR